MSDTPVADVTVDVLIVGAGPVGLYGAYYAGVRGLTVAVVDSLPEAGGQVTALYPEKLILDIAGVPAVKGRDLVASLLAQAAPFAPRYLLGEQARDLLRENDGGFVVTTEAGTVVRCGAIVVTGGIGTFQPRPLPSGSDYVGRGVSYFVPDPSVHEDADVVIVGGGDSALDWALMLEPIARSVTVVHRRHDFRAHAASVAAVRASTVRVVTPAQVSGLHGDQQLSAVTVTGPDGGMERLDCTAVIAALGFTANLGPLREWGAHLRDNRHLVVDSAMRTSVTGIYAAGDITDYDGKVRLISVGFGEVATAVNNAAVHLDPAALLFPGHSTDQGAAEPVPA